VTEDQEAKFLTGEEWIIAERPSFLKRHKFKLIGAATLMAAIVAGVCR